MEQLFFITLVPNAIHHWQKDRHNNIPTSFPTKFCTHQKATPPSHRYPSCPTILMLLYRWYTQQETPSLASVMKQPKESTHVLSKYLTVTACPVGGFVWPSELPTVFGWTLKISPISQFCTLLCSSQTLIILPARWCYSDGLHLYFGRRRIEPEPADRLFWPCFALFSSVSPGQDCFFSKIFNPFITSQDTHEIPYYTSEKSRFHSPQCRQAPGPSHPVDLHRDLSLLGEKLPGLEVTITRCRSYEWNEPHFYSDMPSGPAAEWLQLHTCPSVDFIRSDSDVTRTTKDNFLPNTRSQRSAVKSQS